MQENNVLTVPEAAAYLRVSKPTMYNLINRADFPKIKIGRKIIIPRVEFMNWLSREAGGNIASS